MNEPQPTNNLRTISRPTDTIDNRISNIERHNQINKISSFDRKMVFDTENNTFISKSPMSGIMSTYWIGEIVSNIVGGVINNISYNAYQLVINLHHNFSIDNPELTPLYEFWSDIQTSSEQKISFGVMQQLSNSSSVVENHSHSMIRTRIDGDDEYITFVWYIPYAGSTITIAPQVVRIIPHIKYFDSPLSLTSSTGEGGGGGVLLEQFDFYL